MKRLLPFLFLFLSFAAEADQRAYRVEIIVFRNLMAVAEPAVVQELRGFSHVPGLEQTSRAVEPLVDTNVPQEGDSPEDLGVIQRSDLPDDLRVVTQKGTLMDEVWRRLRSSQGYRPLLYSAWKQNRVDYYPPMRIHDQQVIDRQLSPPTSIMVADLAAADPLAAYRSSFYQIDGSVQLRRSRFLHLFLDLEIRAEKLPTETEAGFFDVNEFQPETRAVNRNTKYEIFALKENRQVRTERMQYFDTPYFGALVLITAIQAE